MFTHDEEKCRTTKGLLLVLSNKFKPQHDRIITLLQYCTLHRKSNESAYDWMGRLQTKAAECEFKEYDRLLTEQFIGWLNDEGMIDKIVREVAT